APHATTAPRREQGLRLSARWDRPPAPGQPARSPLRGRGRVAPLARPLLVPSHWGVRGGSLSCAAEPTARTEPVHRRALVRHRRSLASTSATSRGRGTDRHRTPAHLLMADPRTAQPQLSRLPKCVESACILLSPKVDAGIPTRRDGVTLTQMGHCSRNPGAEMLAVPRISLLLHRCWCLKTLSIAFAIR